MGLLSALGRRGLRALQSGEMFGSWDDVARSAGMSQDDAIDIIQRLKSGGQVNNVERRLARDMIAHIRGNYDNPEIQNSPVRRAFQAEYTGPQGGAAMGALGGASLGMAGGGMGRILQRAAGQEPETIGALMFRKQNLERLRQQVAQRAQQSPLYSEDRQMLNSIEAQLRMVDEDIAALGGP